MSFDASNATFAILGVPVDLVRLEAVLDLVDRAAVSQQPMMISTVNANFLAASQRSEMFRTSLVKSDLCTVDGMGVLLLCRLLGINALSRVSGADILERLCNRTETRIGRPLRVFFFGGEAGVAEAARRRVNASASRAVQCVGSISPGFGTIEELSRSEWIEEINDAHPDLLVLALGAERGQAWLLHNAERLRVPVRTHLGAAINFLTGKVRRAPPLCQKLGLEWLWRITQEPRLARRYYDDGVLLAQLVLGKVLPLAAMQTLDRIVARPAAGRLRVAVATVFGNHVIALDGCATGDCVKALAAPFSAAMAATSPVALDLRNLASIDIAGIGAIMRLRRDLARSGRELRLVHMRPRILRRLQLDAAGWLI